MLLNSRSWEANRPERTIPAIGVELVGKAETMFPWTLTYRENPDSTRYAHTGNEPQRGRSAVENQDR